MSDKIYIEVQKEMSDTLDIIHKKLQNIVYKKDDIDTKKELIQLMMFIFDEMLILQKDIKISESDTENNNSL